MRPGPASLTQLLLGGVRKPLGTELSVPRLCPSAHFFPDAQVCCDLPLPWSRRRSWLWVLGAPDLPGSLPARVHQPQELRASLLPWPPGRVRLGSGSAELSQLRAARTYSDVTGGSGAWRWHGAAMCCCGPGASCSTLRGTLTPPPAHKAALVTPTGGRMPLPLPGTSSAHWPVLHLNSPCDLSANTCWHLPSGGLVPSALWGTCYGLIHVCQWCSVRIWGYK